jgi:hypothetical protein
VSMRLIQIYAQGHGKFADVFPDGKTQAELLLEDIVGRILLEFCTVVLMEEVTISLVSPHDMEQPPYCAISIQAFGTLSSTVSRKHKLESIEADLEGRISEVLMELFEFVHAERTMISASPVTISSFLEARNKV